MKYTDFTCRQVGDTDERLVSENSGPRHIELGRSPYGGRKFGNPTSEKNARVRSGK